MLYAPDKDARALVVTQVGRPVQARLTVTSVKSLRGRMRVAFETKLLSGSDDAAVFIDGEAVAVIPEASIGSLSSSSSSA